MEYTIYPHSTIKINYFEGQTSHELKSKIKEKLNTNCKECGCINDLDQTVHNIFEYALKFRQISILSGKEINPKIISCPTRWDEMSSFLKICKLNDLLVNLAHEVFYDSEYDFKAINRLKLFGDYSSREADNIYNDFIELCCQKNNKNITRDNSSIIPRIWPESLPAIKAAMEDYFNNYLTKIQQIVANEKRTVHFSQNPLFFKFEIYDLPLPKYSFRVTTQGDIWIIIPRTNKQIPGTNNQMYSPTLGFFGVKKSVQYEVALNNIETNNTKFILPLLDIARIDGKTCPYKFNEIITQKYSLITQKCVNNLIREDNDFGYLNFLNEFILCWTSLIRNNGYMHPDPHIDNVLRDSFQHLVFIDCDELSKDLRLSKNEFTNLNDFYLTNHLQQKAFYGAIINFIFCLSNDWVPRGRLEGNVQELHQFQFAAFLFDGQCNNLSFDELKSIYSDKVEALIDLCYYHLYRNGSKHPGKEYIQSLYTLPLGEILTRLESYTNRKIESII